VNALSEQLLMVIMQKLAFEFRGTDKKSSHYIEEEYHEQCIFSSRIR
jgi:hypothetical protein